MVKKETTRARLISKLKDHYKVEKSIDLAKLLSATDKKTSGWNAKIATWPKDDKPISHTEILNLVKDAVDAAVQRERDKSKAEREEIYKTFIVPIIEYFPIKKTLVQKQHEILPDDSESISGRVRDDLEESKRGVYIFYDSRGRAIYVGKTEKKTLWVEMNLAFNRAPHNDQKIYRIDHKSNAQTKDVLGPKPVKLLEVAKYFSAYKVRPEMVHNIEALLIRALADNLLNKKMETFKL